jgi:hypothetical protein
VKGKKFVGSWDETPSFLRAPSVTAPIISEAALSSTLDPRPSTSTLDPTVCHRQHSVRPSPIYTIHLFTRCHPDAEIERLVTMPLLRLLLLLQLLLPPSRDHS